MIRWSFWVDAWEHPFNTWSRKTPDAFVEPLPVEIAAGLPSIPEPVIPMPSREWSAYELAVIGYYNRFGYVDVKTDRAIIQDYHESRREDSTRDPQYADYPDAVDWFHEDYFHDPHAIRIGPYTDETVPQIVKYI